MKKYTPTIGIEVHAELKTQTKMFCGSKNDPHAGEPNSHTCPICMGHPGTLPVINKEAVNHVLKVGKAIGASLASFTEFDRKNYFYPDIPKGYQISQYAYPLVSGGELAGVQITRVHLEEDTARSLHDVTSGSVVDYNRAGVPLMELVTEPVIHDAESAGNFARELQLLLRTLDVSGAQMERGEMRVEANISVSDTDTFGTKVEVKNLNSFKAVEGAIEYEIKRQIEALEKGDRVIQETRGWDEAKGKTFSQRVKESANDYRYFPDPDLPKLDVAGLANNIVLPILPLEKREKYGNIGLSREQIEVIIHDQNIDIFFAKIVATGQDLELYRLVANYLVTDLLPMFGDTTEICFLNAEYFCALVQMARQGRITSRVVKDLLKEVVCDGVDPEKLVVERNLLQQNDEQVLMEIVARVLSENPAVVEDVRSGKESALQFLVGQGMRLSKGSANPKVLIGIFKSQIQ